MSLTADQIALAQRLYDDRMEPRRIARQLGDGVTAADVRAHINCHRVRKIDPALKARVRKIRRDEWLSYALIAKRLGIQTTTVETCCRGLALPIGVSVKKLPNYGGAAASHRTKADYLRVQVPQFEPVEVPAWVPDHLHEFYEAIAQRDCEQRAASICRTLKAGGSVASL